MMRWCDHNRAIRAFARHRNVALSLASLPFSPRENRDGVAPLSDGGVQC